MSNELTAVQRALYTPKDRSAEERFAKAAKEKEARLSNRAKAIRDEKDLSYTQARWRAEREYKDSLDAQAKATEDARIRDHITAQATANPTQRLKDAIHARATTPTEVDQYGRIRPKSDPQ